MLIALGLFIPRLFGKTLTPRFARALGILLIVIAIGLALQVARYAYDRSVINDYRVAQDAATKARDAKAIQEADLQQAKRTIELEQQNIELEAAATQAVRVEPEKARATVGPVTQSYYDTLRKRKK